MDNNEAMVTEPVVEATKTEESKTYTQEDFNNVVAKEVKTAKEKLLKELGVEDFKSAKDGIAKAKEIQEAQKTDLQKALERAEKAEALIATYEADKKDREDIDNIGNILKSKNIDSKYAKIVKKLIGNFEINDESVTKIINDELPMLVSDSQNKVGIEKHEETLKSSTKSYLDEKYKNNPFYKK